MSIIVTILLCLVAVSLLPALVIGVVVWCQEILWLIHDVIEERSADAILTCSVGMALSLAAIALIVHLGIKYLM